MGKIFISKSVFFAAIVFSLYLHEGAAIRCYQCTSFPKSGCGDDFRLNYVQIVDCNDPHGHQHYLPAQEQARWCKKEKRKTSDGIEITRGCLSPQEMQEYSEMDPYSDTEVCSTSMFNQFEMCRCRTELCNNAPPIHRNFILFLSLIFAYLGYFFILS